MSSKRKSPPTKLEGGGVACEQQQTNHHQNHSHRQILHLQHPNQDQQHNQHHPVNCESSVSGNGPISVASDGDPGSDRDAVERSPTPPRLSGQLVPPGSAPDSCPSTPSEGTTPTPATTPNTTPTPIVNNVDSDSEGPCKKQRLEDTLARQSALLGLHVSN